MTGSAETRTGRSAATALPSSFHRCKHTLFRNNGDRTFTDVTVAAGLARADGHGFAAVAADLDGDGKTDLYVANDQDPHFLYLNNGNGTFRDVSEDSGAAYDIEGRTQAGMGVDAEDVDGDGRPELFVTNFDNEYNTLYRNLGRGYFVDATASFGLAADSVPYISWGCALADLDNDGWPDAVVANAEIDDNAESLGKTLSYEQPPLLHHNLAGQRFRLANRGAGAYFEGRHLGHGLAIGDLDDDGDLDLVINHKDGPPAILRNDTPTPTTGFASCWSARAARVMRSGRASRSRLETASSAGSRKAGTASCLHTTPESSSGWDRPRL